MARHAIREATCRQFIGVCYCDAVSGEVRYGTVHELPTVRAAPYMYRTYTHPRHAVAHNPQGILL